MTITRRTFLKATGILAASSVLSLPAHGEPSQKPNIIVFLADDLGYGDLGCYGNPIIKTPHIDKLAEEGLRLTDCHSAGVVCSPSRASLLTGRTPYRVGFYAIAGREGAHLLQRETTVASILKQQGYDTCFAGKWHLGEINDPAAGQPGPGEHGFDHWFATQVNAFDGPENPGKFIRNGEKAGPPGKWYCDAIVEEVISWMEQRPDPKKPFFLLLCSHEPHTPVRPPETYSKMYDNEEVDTLESSVSYGQIHRPVDRGIKQNKKYYYGTVTQLDRAFGRLMQAVNRMGYEENSLVVFTSDNGPETPVTLEESGGQWEDPIRDRCFGTPGPWRGMKRYVYEGGHRVPGIVRYPGTVQPGTLSSQLVNGTDWMPTICALCDAPPPADRVIDGVSLLPLFEGELLERPVPACWMLPADYPGLPSMAMRRDDLVVIGWFNARKKDQGMSEWVKTAELTRFELYDLSLDVSQRHDLGTIRKEESARLKAEMSKLWREIREEGPLWKKR